MWTIRCLEIKIQIMKKPFYTVKKRIFQSPKNHIFPKGLTHDFGQKIQFFSSFCFCENKT